MAQIRLISTFPPVRKISTSTRLGAVDPNMGLHLITHSTRQGQRNADIVSVDRIIRGCQLMAWCGQNILSTLTTDNVLEQTLIQYLVNPYITVDSFTLLKASFFMNDTLSVKSIGLYWEIM